MLVVNLSSAREAATKSPSYIARSSEASIVQRHGSQLKMCRFESPLWPSETFRGEIERKFFIGKEYSVSEAVQ